MAYYMKAMFWYLKCYTKYTKYGFENAATRFTPIDSDVNGWSFLVTGGSSGIGKAIAMDLVKRKGSLVHIVCSNPVNGEEAMKILNEQRHSESKVYLHLVDMSEPSQIVEFVNKIKSESIKINILINNAGILSPVLHINAGGLDKAFCVNVIGTYLFTDLLAEHLVESSKNVCKPRVITVSSGGMLTTSLDAENPTYVRNYYDGTAQYAHHKRQQVVLMDIFADKYKDIQFSSMHPGWVDTPGVQTSLPGFYKKHQNNLRTPQQGADTVIWLAISSEALSFSSGQFFLDRNREKKFLVSNDERYSKDIEETYLIHLLKIVSKYIKS